MVPWPIALLALWYGALAASTGAMLWRAADRMAWGWSATASLLAGCSAAAAIGLPLFKSWALRLAVAVEWLVAFGLLLAAMGCVAAGRPGWGLGVTVAAGSQWIIVRYLRRPAVQSLFGAMDGAHLLR